MDVKVVKLVKLSEQDVANQRKMVRDGLTYQLNLGQQHLLALAPGRTFVRSPEEVCKDIEAQLNALHPVVERDVQYVYDAVVLVVSLGVLIQSNCTKTGSLGVLHLYEQCCFIFFLCVGIQQRQVGSRLTFFFFSDLIDV